jgi:hypothetical protein
MGAVEARGAEGEEGGEREKINAREAAQHNDGDRAMETEDGSPTGGHSCLQVSHLQEHELMSAERMTYAKRNRHARPSARTGQHTCIQQKKHVHRMTRWGTQERMVYLTLVSSRVWHRFGTELSKPRVDRHTTVRARRASFGASSSGWKEVGAS